jgi:hypothetical protein
VEVADKGNNERHNKLTEDGSIHPKRIDIKKEQPTQCGQGEYVKQDEKHLPWALKIRNFNNKNL